MPKISVISPAYNHEKYVGEAVQSVLNQTLSDFELVITDDGSTDKTISVIRQFDDPRIKLFCFDHNQGTIVASENSYRHSTGEYVAWLCTDDIYEANMLDTLATYLDKYTEMPGVFGLCSYIDEDGKPLDQTWPNEFTTLNRYQKLRRLFNVENYFCASAAMIRRSVLEEIGYFSAHFCQIDDMVHWIRMLFRSELPVINEHVIRFRLRANDANRSSLDSARMQRLNFEVFELLNLFLQHITNTNTLRQIFPEVETHQWPLEEELIPFHFSHLALQGQLPAHRLFGLHLLFQQMSNSMMAKKIKSRCGFGYPELFKLELEQQVFFNHVLFSQVHTAHEHEKSKMQATIDDLWKNYTNLEQIHKDMLNSTTWKISSLPRCLINKIRNG